MCGCGAPASAILLTLTIGISGVTHEMVNVVCDNGILQRNASIGVRHIMSATVTTQPKPTSTRGAAGDGRILAQVEKWMAMIREISREQMPNSVV
jgi:hypothetical protein